jgi:LemA protein
MAGLGLVLLIPLIIVGAIALFLVGVFNALVVMRNRLRNAESQIDVQLKRRFDLIPNLVETVKGYAKHEKALFENVSKARAAWTNATTIGEKAKAGNMMASTLKSLFAVAENYPALKANENFMMLQEELSGTESKIAYARQFYNDTCQSYNTSVEQFPTNIVAGMFGFAKKDFFEMDVEEKKPVKVKFE